MATNSIIEAEEIDRFLASQKWLDGPEPEWRVKSFFKRDGNQEYEAVWSIKDDIGIVGKGQLRFAFRPWNRAEPSVSIVYGQRNVARVDFVESWKCELNPHWAATLGIPAKVCGNHAHKWEDNRPYILSQERWHLPCRVPLPPQVRRLPQGLGWLAEYANIHLGPGQHEFDIPQGIL
jgi:hypothetical protein